MKPAERAFLICAAFALISGAAVVGLPLAARAPAQEAATASPGLSTSVDAYSRRYAGLSTPFDSIMDDRGTGFAGVAGTRNFRVVLRGILYRGGANNAYGDFRLADQKRRQGPLQARALQNLCKEGFADAFFAYGNRALHETVNCARDRGSNVLSYRGLRPQSPGSDRREFLRILHDQITGPDHRPVFVHCWNGYHASGIAAAVALRQFCGISAEDAVAYWKSEAPSLPEPAQTKSIDQIRNFSPIPELTLTPADQKIVCYGGALVGQKAVYRLPKAASATPARTRSL